jgi:O-methyltransferase
MEKQVVLKKTLKLFIVQMFTKLGYQIQRIPLHLYGDETFSSLVKQIEGYTLVDQIRCFNLYQFAKQARGMNGDVAEIGVYKGGTAKLISKVVAGTTKVVHLFDTFSGMPPTDSTKDLHKKGDFSDTSLDRVKKYLKDCNNVRFYQGFFPDTAGPVINLQFCFVHIDVDIYKSVLDCCKFFYPRMVKGGIMVFDDYGFLSCPGAKMAVDEFFSDKAEYPCRLPTTQCFIIKI